MSVEDRNCGCDNKVEMSMNMNVTTVENNCCNDCPCSDKCDNDTREEMINNIKCLKFAVIELALYLDTHPDDEKALCLHNKYCKELRILEDKYQKVYGPLTITFPCNKWRWLEEPWPWERGNY